MQGISTIKTHGLAPELNMQLDSLAELHIKIVRPLVDDNID